MIYNPQWVGLREAIERVMNAIVCSTEQAQAAICQSVADRSVRIRGKLKLHKRTSMTAVKTVLYGPALEIPTDLKPRDLDWEASRTIEPWRVLANGYKLSGDWWFDWVEINWPDLMGLLCPGKGGPIPQRAFASPGSGSTSVAGEMIGSGNRRGPRPKKLDQVKEAMRNDIREGRLTTAQLTAMLEKGLQERYDVSRDTARKARTAVLPELDATKQRQISTNDK